MSTLLLLAAMASADVGPPPSCGKDEHVEYCEGNQCVPDGYKLDENCEQVVDPDPPAESDKKGCQTGPGGGLAAAAFGALALRRRARR